jgi:hypothetical protein
LCRDKEPNGSVVCDETYLKRDEGVTEAPSFAIASRRKNERRIKCETEFENRRGVSFGKLFSIIKIGIKQIKQSRAYFDRAAIQI